MSGLYDLFGQSLPGQEPLPEGRSLPQALNDLRRTKPRAPRWHAEVDALSEAQRVQDAEDAQAMRHSLRSKRIALETGDFDPAHEKKIDRIAALERELNNGDTNAGSE